VRDLIQGIGYILLLGPPRAIKMHADAQGTGGELDGFAQWSVVCLELMVRAGVLLVLSWALQEALGHEVFRRFQVTFLLMALAVSGVLHTVVHYYCFGMKKRHWSIKQRMRVYRLGRNLTYSVIPAFPFAGVVLLWQEVNRVPLFHGNIVELTFIGVWVFAAVLGFAEGLWATRIPTGVHHDV
jgi:hypothetical protein